MSHITTRGARPALGEQLVQGLVQHPRLPTPVKRVLERHPGHPLRAARRSTPWWRPRRPPRAASSSCSLVSSLVAAADPQLTPEPVSTVSGTLNADWLLADRQQRPGVLVQVGRGGAVAGTGRRSAPGSSRRPWRPRRPRRVGKRRDRVDRRPDVDQGAQQAAVALPAGQRRGVRAERAQRVLGRDREQLLVAGARAAARARAGPGRPRPRTQEQTAGAPRLLLSWHATGPRPSALRVGVQRLRLERASPAARPRPAAGCSTAAEAGRPCQPSPSASTPPRLPTPDPP